MKTRYLQSKIFGLVCLGIMAINLFSSRPASARRVIEVRENKLQGFIEGEMREFVDLIDRREDLTPVFKQRILEKAEGIDPEVREGLRLLIEGFEEVDGKKLRSGEELILRTLRQNGYTFDISYEFSNEGLIFFRLTVGKILAKELYRLKGEDREIEVLYAKRILASERGEYVASYCSEFSHHPVVIFDWVPKGAALNAKKILARKPVTSKPDSFELVVRASWDKETPVEKIEADIYESLKCVELQNWLDRYTLQKSPGFPRETERMLIEMGGFLGGLANGPMPFFILYELTRLGADYTEGKRIYEKISEAAFFLLAALGQLMPNLDKYFSVDGTLTETGFLRAAIELGFDEFRQICRDLFRRTFGDRMLDRYLKKVE